MEDLTLSVDKRVVTGKKVSFLRREGITPLHLYGSGIESQSLQCSTTLISRLVNEAGTNIPVNLKVEGESRENICFVREVQYHPVTDRVVHVDFMKVDVNKPVRAEVPVIVEGLSPAVRNMGGTLLQPLPTVTVEALPMDIPGFYTLQAELLIDFDTNFYVRDLEINDSVEIINNDDDLLAGIVAPRIESEPEIAGEEGEEGEESEGGEEGEGESEEKA